MGTLQLAVLPGRACSISFPFQKLQRTPFPSRLLSCRCAPEVLLGEPATEKADIYRCGRSAQSVHSTGKAG